MYWKHSLTALLAASRDSWMNTPLFTDEPAHTKMTGPIEILAAPAAAPVPVMCRHGPARRTIRRACKLAEREA